MVQQNRQMYECTSEVAARGMKGKRDMPPAMVGQMDELAKKHGFDDTKTW
jgi:hypothetical protein